MQLKPIVKSYVEELKEELEPLYDALCEDGLDDYSDTVMSVITKLNNLQEVLHNADLGDKLYRV